jgi:hypothetical protein
MTVLAMLDRMAAASSQQQQQEALAGDVLGLRVLLDEVLPVLTHAASLLCSSTSSASGPQDTSGQPALMQENAAQPAGAPDAHTVSLSNTSSLQISDPCTSSHAAARDPAMPVESILLLLGASAQLLRHCVSLAIANNDAYSTLSRSLHPVTPTSPQDDLVAALDAVLALAAYLISYGSCWQQAKAHRLLLLIETLSETAKVGSRHIPVPFLLCSRRPTRLHSNSWSHV